MSDFLNDLIQTQLAPIADLLADPEVSEVMINGPKEIFIEKKGLVFKAPNTFSDEDTLLAAMNAIARSVNRYIDKDNPRLDARLPDGSRVAVVIPPMAKNGTTAAIRKFSEDKLG